MGRWIWYSQIPPPWEGWTSKNGGANTLTTAVQMTLKTAVHINLQTAVQTDRRGGLAVFRPLEHTHSSLLLFIAQYCGYTLQTTPSARLARHAAPPFCPARDRIHPLYVCRATKKDPFLPGARQNTPSSHPARGTVGPFSAQGTTNKAPFLAGAPHGSAKLTIDDAPVAPPCGIVSGLACRG